MNPVVLQALGNLAARGGAIGKMADAYMSVKKWKEVFDSVKSDATDMFNSISQQWIEMQDIAFQTGRSMAMSRDMAMRYDRQLMQTTKELARQYGITAKEIADFQKAYAEATGRNVMLTKQQTEAMAALAKITDSATAAQLVDEFDKVGVGITRATANVGLFQERAKALGVSPAKASKMLADNIKLAASYSFRNGVSDIEKMAMKATSMRMDMNAIMGAVDKFSDIEGAIGTSANIQMLGGSFAREFSNPMGAMYESMADPQAFQERLLRTIEGKGSYDAKTGQVKFDPVTMMQMREMAKQLGMSVDQLTNPAMATVQNQKVKEELQRAGTIGKWSPAELEAIKNLSRTNVNEETGEHQVTYTDVNGELVTKAIKDLTSEELQIAQDRQMDEKGLFSDVQDIKDILDRTLGRARGTTSTKENITGFKEEINSFIAEFQNVWMGTMSGWLNGQSFQPWDLLKGLSTPGRKVDIFTHGTEGLGGLDGPYAFDQGGIVKPIPHAALGTIIPGDSRMGDKTPIMANAGEMVLNQREQKGLFDLLKSIAMTGLMAYGGNKLGKKMGMHGIGTNMALGNLLSGGNLGVGGMLGIGASSLVQGRMMRGLSPMGMMPMGGMMGRTITLMNPTVMMNGQTIMNGSIGGGALVEELEDVALAASVAGKNTRRFSMRLRDAAGKNGIIGSLSRTFLHARTARRKYGRKLSRAVGRKTAKIGNYAKGTSAYKFFDTIKNGTFDTRMHSFGSERGQYRYKNKLVKGSDIGGKKTRSLIRAKGYIQEAFRDTKSLFGRGSASSVANAASKETSAIAKTTTEATKAVSKVGKAGKVLGGLGKAGKLLGKAAGPIGAIMAIGGAVGDISAASSQYDARVDEINKSGMSELDKARAKDKAAKEKNASIGGGVGSAVGAAAGAALGSALGPLGMIAGGWLGEKAGSFIGKGIGSLFGGGEEKKFKKEQAERLKKEGIESSDDIVRILSSINDKLSIISGKKIGIREKSLASPTIKNIGKGMLGLMPGLGPIGALMNVFGSTSLGEKVKDRLPQTPTDALKSAVKLTPIGGVATAVSSISSKSPMDKMYEAMDSPVFRERLAKSGIKVEQPAVTPVEKMKSNISLEPIQAKVEAKPDNSSFLRVTPTKQEVSSTPSNISLGKTDINLNISGTIKLDGGGKTADLDLGKLLETPEFKRQLAEVITRKLNENSNSGKRNMESERNNMASQYNRSGK